MKKTLNINLAGYPFIIDEDAYNLLKDYLDTIRYAFNTKEDTEDLAADIETRIAEILLENEGGKVRIVSFREISQVIERIGKPSDFIELEETEEGPGGSKTEEKIIAEEGQTPPPFNPEENSSASSFSRRKIFRDPQNAIIGGVCAGIANYLHIDLTLVRILTVLLFFLSASTVAIVYIILWIVVPEANTPLKRMQMMGQDPTVENIGKTVTENFQDMNAPTPPPQRSGLNKFIYTSCSIFVKILVVLVLIIAFPVVFALIVVFIACIAALCVPGSEFSQGFLGNGVGTPSGYGAMIFHLLLAIFGAIITIGIPLWLYFTRNRKGTENKNKFTDRRFLVILWIIGIALTSVFIPKTVKDVKRIEKKESLWYKFYENFDTEDFDDYDFDDYDFSDTEQITVDKNSVKIKTKDGKIKTITKEGITIEDVSAPTDSTLSQPPAADAKAEIKEKPDSLIN